jgi:phosphohistidine phosphatase
MELYLVRHAAAEERAPNGRDEARALTPSGRREFARVARGLGHLGVEFDQLLHSPLLRAQETADLLAPLVVGGTVVTGELARDPSTELFPLCTGLRIALVGHEPWLCELCAWLVTDRKSVV